MFLKAFPKMRPGYTSAIRQLRFFSIFPKDKIRIINVTTNSIHKNLAYEDFLFHHDDLKYPTLMMWRNDKNIVIGKHQNPYKECYIQKMEADNIALCRRKSGGGAVYQDLGNTCFTF
jgi:lipoate-protein ligase A